MANDEQQLKKLKNKQVLVDSLAHIQQEEKKEADQKQLQELENFKEVYPKASKKLLLKLNNDMSKLTKVELVSILLIQYKTAVGKQAKKGTLIEKLQLLQKEEN